MPHATPDLLRRALDLAPFDGHAAQRDLEPRTRGPRPAGADDRPPRDAAALASFHESGAGLRLPLTVRRQDLREHRGQVSLPGGRPEPDEPLWATALREAREEIGLRPDGLERLGVLAPVYIPVTHTRLHVHVALGPDPGPLVRAPQEVDRIVLVRLDDLLDPRRLRTRPLPIAGALVEVPYFDVEGLFLWGATAMALADLCARLRSVGA